VLGVAVWAVAPVMAAAQNKVHKKRLIVIRVCICSRFNV
jgi:hypothetical protein